MLLTSNLLNARKHLCQLADIPRQTLIFQLSSRFTSANITGIAARQGKLRQTNRI